MDAATVVGHRDRALVVAMAFTFARVSAVVGLKVEDYYPQNKRWWLRLREKNGKVNEMPCHHKLEAYMDAYMAAAGIEGDRTGRCSGITDYLTNGGRIEVAQRMAGHANAKTAGLYDRRNDDINLSEVERIGI